MNRIFWTLVLSSAAIMAVTIGARQSLGLFVSPLNTSTGLGIVTISFALAVGQFAWGAAQPLFGILADRIGSFRVIVIGALMLMLGLALTPYMHSGLGLTIFRSDRNGGRRGELRSSSARLRSVCPRRSAPSPRASSTPVDPASHLRAAVAGTDYSIG
jgi:hypothetical protein